MAKQAWPREGSPEGLIERCLGIYLDIMRRKSFCTPTTNDKWRRHVLRLHLPLSTMCLRLLSVKP